MRWSYEGKVSLKTLFYIHAAGTVSKDDFEVDELQAYREDGEERQLTQQEDNDIVEWLTDKAPVFYEQALESAGDDVYDRYRDRD
jgi:hypothetical protein